MPRADSALPSRVSVDFEPIGRRVEVPAGTDLLSAARAAGVQIVSLCGGIGSCTSCRVRLALGTLSPLTLIEEDTLPEEERLQGFRLACQSQVLSDVKIDVPPESLSASQRLQVEGEATDIEPDPAVTSVDLRLDPPTLHDLRSDATRLGHAFQAQGFPIPHINLPILTQLSDQLRGQGWAARVALQAGEVVALLPPGSPLLGLAVDIGTTKLAAYLVDLASGRTLAKRGAMNPQISYGEDVISRIVYANGHEKGRTVLQEKLVETINDMLEEMCVSAGARPEQIVDAVVVGNTVMHHLFAGLPVSQLGFAPYVPCVSDPIELRASEVGLTMAPSATVYLPPVIAGYVGADHVSMLLATGMDRAGSNRIALDIGTNTEISLATGGRLMCCSCASGPAFEGAHIKDGMRASPGAIERVQIVDGNIRLYTIDGQQPVGICGSGILDAVAQMRAASILSESGRMAVDYPLLRGEGKQTRLVLAEPPASGHGREVVVTREDVNQIQLAKGAIRAGIEILLGEASLVPGDLEAIIVAGAFGTYLDTSSAVKIGMFPDLPAGRFRQVGNAAGMGAKQMLVSRKWRREAASLAQRMEYVELTTHARFHDVFLQAMYL